MKNQTFKIVICALGLFFCILSCQHEEFFLPRPQVYFKNQQALPKAYRDAMAWYRANSWRVYESSTKSGGRHPLFGEMEPNWEQAFVNENDNYTIVEATLKTLESVLFILPQNTELFEMSKDKRYRQTITRLVVRTHKKTHETDAFFMSILPSASYLESVDFKPFYKNNYLTIDELFDGVIVFHDLNGTRANGYVYENGTVTKILPRSDSFIQTKGISTYTKCVDVYEETCTTFVVVTEYEGQVVNHYVDGDCTTEYIGQDCWTEVAYIPDEIGGGSGSGSGSGSGGGDGGSGSAVEYWPPACNKCGNTPCTCIRNETNCNQEVLNDVKNTYNLLLQHRVQEDFIDKYKNSKVEWGAAYIEKDGKIKLDTIMTNNAPAKVSIRTSAETIATIHNHPSGNGPSMADVQILAKQTLIFNLRTICVCTASDKIFALHVVNPAAVEFFYQNYCDSLGIENMKMMKEEYTNTLKKYDRENYNSVQASLYALSTVLHLTGSGMEVLEGRMVDGQMVFDLRKGMSITVERKKIVRRSICPGSI